jgi:hypothetical protein
MQWLHRLNKADPGLDRSAFIRPISGWRFGGFRHWSGYLAWNLGGLDFQRVAI